MTTQLEGFTTTELAAKYNAAALELGEPTVKRFSDKKSALRRTAKILTVANGTKIDPPEPALAPVDPPATVKRQSGSLNYLGMRQDIRPMDDQVVLKREGSIRAACLELLRGGASYDQLVDVFKTFDTTRGRATKGDYPRRIYEMIRIFCHHYGYGTRSSEDGQTITLITN